MSGRQSQAVSLALRLVERGHTVTDAAKRHEIAVSSLRRALRRSGVPPLPRGRKSSI